MGDDDAPDQCHLQQQSQGHERFRLASCILSILAKKAPTLHFKSAALRMTLRPFTRRRAADVATVDQTDFPEVAW